MSIDARTLTPLTTRKLGKGPIVAIRAAATADHAAVIVRASPEHIALVSSLSLDPIASLSLPSAKEVAWSPDGSRFAVTRTDGLSILDLQGQPIAHIDGARGVQMCAVFSADGSRIATGSRDGGVSVWNALNGDLALELPLARTETPLALGFTPDADALIVQTSTSPASRFQVSAPSPADAEAREISRRAKDTVARFKAAKRFAHDTAEAIRLEPGIDEKVRAEAIRQVRVIGDQAAVLNNKAYVRVREPIDDATLLVALRESSAALEVCSDPFGYLVHAVVLYRAKRYQEAIDMFQRAEAGLSTTRANWGEGPPELAVFRGLAEAALGRKDEAERWFARYERVIAEPRYAAQIELPGFAREIAAARQALTASPSPPPPSP